MKKLNIVKPQRASYQKQTIDEIIDPFIDDDEIIDKWNGQNVNGDTSKAIAVDTLFTETACDIIEEKPINNIIVKKTKKIIDPEIFYCLGDE